MFSILKKTITKLKQYIFFSDKYSLYFKCLYHAILLDKIKFYLKQNTDGKKLPMPEM